MTEATINANLNQCIKATVNIGETVYTNICSGTTAIVPWGTFDWAERLFLLGIISVLIAFLGFLGYLMYTD